jgi:multiple sugar transport system substrate-binding protein
MPRYINVMTFHYNIDRFLAAGLPDPSELDRQGQWTWETLRETARKLTRRDSDQAIHYGATLSSQSLPRVLNWIWGAGGDLLDPQDPTKFVADTPQAETGMQFLCSMMWEDAIASPSFAHTGFLNGTVPIVEEGMQGIFQFRDVIGDAFEWDSIRRPAGPVGRPGYLVDDSFGIWVDTRHPEEAWQLLKFFVSREGQAIMIKHSLLPPVRRSAASTYLKLAPDHNLGAFIDAVADSRPTVYSRMLGDISQIQSALWEMLQSALRNTQPYRVAVDAYRPRIKALLAEATQ